MFVAVELSPEPVWPLYASFLSTHRLTQVLESLDKHRPTVKSHACHVRLRSACRVLLLSRQQSLGTEQPEVARTMDENKHRQRRQKLLLEHDYGTGSELKGCQGQLEQVLG